MNQIAESNNILEVEANVQDSIICTKNRTGFLRNKVTMIHYYIRSGSKERKTGDRNLHEDYGQTKKGTGN